MDKCYDKVFSNALYVQEYDRRVRCEQAILVLRGKYDQLMHELMA
jgi:hypothetical protein